MIIAITGKRKTGKSTLAADIVSANAGMSMRRVAFATAMKEALSKDYSIPLNELYHAERKEKYRSVMQSYAENARQADPLIWIRPVLDVISDNTHSWIVEDLHYINELEALHKRGAFIVQMRADDCWRTQRGAAPDATVDTHVSETDVAILPPDVIQALGGIVIFNNGVETYGGVACLTKHAKIVLERAAAYTESWLLKQQATI